MRCTDNAGNAGNTGNTEGRSLYTEREWLRIQAQEKREKKKQAQNLLNDKKDVWK